MIKQLKIININSEVHRIKGMLGDINMKITRKKNVLPALIGSCSSIVTANKMYWNRKYWNKR
jgi:hypothetical protein